MSLINQMVNQMEQRGAQFDTEDYLVRSVRTSRRSSKLGWWLLALALIAAISGWAYVRYTSRAVVPVSQLVASTGIKRQSQPEVSVAISDASSAVVMAPVFQLSLDLSEPISKVVTETIQTVVPEKLPQQAVVPERQAKVAKAGNLAPPSPPLASDGIPEKKISTQQRADAEFRKGIAHMQQGRSSEALQEYKTALELDAAHDKARQALVLLLIESKRNAEAEHVLLEGIKTNPEKLGFVMMAARLQVERGATNEAVQTLESSLHYASTHAEYQAFLAALMQRQQRHQEAVTRYQTALALKPDNGLWWMGEAISLQALQQNKDAKLAYQHALDSKNLGPDLEQYVQQRLKEL